MKLIAVGGAIAILTLCAGCADPSVKDSSILGASGQHEAPVINMKDGVRHEYMVGSRIARETRENSESVKTLGPKAYREGRLEKQGSPLDGGG